METGTAQHMHRQQGVRHTLPITYVTRKEKLDMYVSHHLVDRRRLSAVAVQSLVHQTPNQCPHS